MGLQLKADALTLCVTIVECNVGKLLLF